MNEAETAAWDAARSVIDRLDDRVFGRSDVSGAHQIESTPAGIRRTAADRQRAAEAFVGGGRGAGAAVDGRPAGDSWRRAIEWARQSRALIERLPEWLSHLENYGGGEHDAWYDAESGRWLKFAREQDPAEFGMWPVVDEFGYAMGHGTVADYLGRLRETNAVFEDDLVLHGLVTENGRQGILISQPHVDGRPATMEEVRQAMATQGFERVGLVDYLRRADGRAVFDLHLGNVLVGAHGELLPIDAVTAQTWPALRAAMEKQMIEEDGKEERRRS